MCALIFLKNNSFNCFEYIFCPQVIPLALHMQKHFFGGEAGRGGERKD